MKIPYFFYCFSGLIFAGNQLAWAAAPTDTELKRFVAAYRVSENIVTTLKVINKMSSERSSVAQTAFVKCVADQIKPEALLPYSVSLAKESFDDAAQLNDVSAFFEKNAGKRLVDTTVAHLTSLLEKPSVTQADFYPKLSFTPAEMVEINELARRPGYAGWVKFNKNMKSVVSPERMRALMATMEKECPVDVREMVTR